MTSPSQTVAAYANKAKFLYLLTRKGKISPAKVVNALRNLNDYRTRKIATGRTPTVALFDTTNKCNIFCVACRKTTTEIIDVTGRNEAPIQLGTMPLRTFQRIIDELADRIMLAVLYVSGEPLMNRSIYDMVAHASRRRVGTLLSTNGGPLTEDASRKLIDADLDYLKIAVSGYTQPVHEIYHRGSKIEQVLANVERFAELKNKRRARTRVVMDYILFEHNPLELPLIRQFCRDTGIEMTVRSGRKKDQQGVETPPEHLGNYTPNRAPCDWIWQIAAFSFDGRVLPCCEFAYTGKPRVMGISDEDTDVASIWNGESYLDFRKAHRDGQRGNLPVCENCFYSGLYFQS